MLNQKIISNYSFQKIVGENGMILLHTIQNNENYYLDKFQLVQKEREELSLLKGKRRLEYLAVRYLLYANIIGEHIVIKYDDKRKPSFGPSIKNHLSISHSDDKVVLYIADDPCGIDIQCYSDTMFLIRDKFLHEKEKLYINSEQSLNQLHIIWSAKESIYKLYGKKGLIFKEDIRIDQFLIPTREFQITGHYSIGNETFKVHMNVVLRAHDVLVYTL